MDLKTYLAEERGRSVSLAGSIGVSAVTIHEWSAGKKRVPADRCPAIERATHGAVSCEDLRPDVDWACLRVPKKAAA